MPTNPATILSPAKETLARMHARRHAEKRASEQSKLFPDWPDNRRGAPPHVLRSSIFGVLQRGRKKRIVDMPVATNDEAVPVSRTLG